MVTSLYWGKKHKHIKLREKKCRSRKKRVSTASIRDCQVRMLLFININTNGNYGIQLPFVQVSHTLVSLISSFDCLFCSTTELDGSNDACWSTISEAIVSCQ